MVIPAVLGVHHPEVTRDPELVFTVGSGLDEFVRVGRYGCNPRFAPQIVNIG